MPQSLRWINWSHSFVSYPEVIEKPTSEAELRNILIKAEENNKTVKVIGSGHSCSLIGAVNNGILIDLKSYNKIIQYDTNNKLLTVQAGISLLDISNFALENNVALPNLGTIVDQTVSGAISTGTHGSGINYGALDQVVIAFSVLKADGGLKIFDKRTHPNEFHTAIVGLGAIGIITTVTIQLVNNYNLHIKTKAFSFDDMIAKIELYKKDDYMRFWWAPHTGKVQYWQAFRTSAAISKKSKLFSWFSDIFIGNFLHELGLWLTSFNLNKVPALNKFIFWALLEKENETISNFLDGFTLPINVKQSVMEYGIPIEETATVLQKIKLLLEHKNYKVHMPIEVRFAPKNNAALSMAANRDTCYIGIIAYKPFGKVLDYDLYFKDVHAIFAEHQGRPHWAKVNHYSKEELLKLYPSWSKFVSLKTKLDPKGRFMNDFLKRLF